MVWSFLNKLLQSDPRVTRNIFTALWLSFETSDFKLFINTYYLQIVSVGN